MQMLVMPVKTGILTFAKVETFHVREFKGDRHLFQKLPDLSSKYSLSFLTMKLDDQVFQEVSEAVRKLLSLVKFEAA